MIEVNNRVIDINRFSDGTCNIKNVPMYKNIMITWRYENDSEFLAVSFLNMCYKAHGCKVFLFLPYVPNARMDRIEKSGEVFTMKYFAELLNSLSFERVYILDPHSSVAPALIKNCYEIHPTSIVKSVIDKIADYEKTIPLMFFTDEGAMKRYSKNIKHPFGFGIKNRDWYSGKITSYEIFGLTQEEIKDKVILIQDDICSKGSTFYYSAKKLRELGAKKIYLFATHCEPNMHNCTVGKEDVSLIETGLIDKMYTTDSIYNLGMSDKINVIKCFMSDYIGDYSLYTYFDGLLYEVDNKKE